MNLNHIHLKSTNLKSALLTTILFAITPLLAADANIDAAVPLTSPSDGEVMVQQNVPEQLTLAKKNSHL